MKSIFTTLAVLVCNITLAQNPYLISAVAHKLSPGETAKLSNSLLDYKVFVIENKNILKSIDKVSPEFIFDFSDVAGLPEKSFKFVDSRLVSEKTYSSGGGSKINHYKAIGR